MSCKVRKNVTPRSSRICVRRSKSCGARTNVSKSWSSRWVCKLFHLKALKYFMLATCRVDSKIMNSTVFVWVISSWIHVEKAVDLWYKNLKTFQNPLKFITLFVVTHMKFVWFLDEMTSHVSFVCFCLFPAKWHHKCTYRKPLLAICIFSAQLSFFFFFFSLTFKKSIFFLFSVLISLGVSKWLV